MTMSRKSEVWTFFIKTSGGGKCKFCHKELKSSGNTTNLMNHISRKHGFSKHRQNLGKDKKNQSKSSNTGTNLGQGSARDNLEQHGNDALEFEGEDRPTTSGIVSGCGGSMKENLWEQESDMEVNALQREQESDVEMGVLEQDASRSNYRVFTTTTATSASSSSRQSASSGLGSLGVTLSQRRISESFSEIQSFKDGGNKSIQLTEALLYMIVKDNLPLNTTEKEGFQYFFKKALPHFKAPGRTKITQLIDDRHEVLRRKIQQRLALIDHVSITADVWTDTINTRSFLGATVHFIYETRLCSIVICLKELTETHTSDFLMEILRTTFKEWEISIYKICAIVTDNGANIVKAITNLLDKNKHLPCFSHTLNLVAQKICDEENVAALLSAVKAIVTYFKHSVAASDELRKVTNLKLIQSVVTRWNSSFVMIERFLKLRDEIGTILLRFPKSPRMLTASEIQEAQEVINLLQPIEAASREICGDHYITASKIIPIVNMLNKKVMDLNFETQTGQSLKNSFVREMTKRFGKIEEVNLLAIATLMDARFKRIHFTSPIAVSQAVSKLKSICEAASQKQIGGITTQHEGDIDEPTIVDSADDNDDDIWSFHKKLVKEREAAYSISSSHSNGSDEVRHYLNQPVIDIREDPIQFWDRNKIIYPVLSKICGKFLCVVGTSVPSERLFSLAGNIMDPNRSRLTPTRLSNLVFLNSLPFEDWHLQ